MKPSIVERMRPQLAWRLAGLAALGMSLLSSLAHRKLLALHGSAAPSLWEMLLALTSFLLASLGVLLLINGAKLFGYGDGPDLSLDARMARRALHYQRASRTGCRGGRSTK